MGRVGAILGDEARGEDSGDNIEDIVAPDADDFIVLR